MTTNDRSVELAGVNFTGQNHVCAFFNTMDEEHRVLGSFYKGGFERGEKATHIVDAENREAYLKRLKDAGIKVQELMDSGGWKSSHGPTCMCVITISTRMRCWLQSKT